MQELIDENKILILEQAVQHTGDETDVPKRYKIEFGQIYLAKPTMTEADGTAISLLPSEARLRNLT